MREFGVVIIFAVTWAVGAHPQAPRMAADSIVALTVMCRQSVDNGMRTAHAAERPTLICVARFPHAPSPALLTALRNSESLLFRASASCRIESLRIPSAGPSLVVDTLIGQRGIDVRVNHVTFSANRTLFIQTRYHANGRSSTYWDCTGVSRSETREIVACQMTRIS